MKRCIPLAVLLVITGLVLAWFLYPWGNNSAKEENITPPIQNETAEENLNNINDQEIQNMTATFKTNKGDIVIELFTEKMPITTGNFIKLTKEGFYDGTKFHRVIKGFMIQGGDPNTKGANTATYGQGGPGYTIQDEFVEGLSNVHGTISMANTGQANSGGSQFFINLVDNSFLDFNKEPMASKHPVFGLVIEGMDVVNAIANVATGARDMPINPVIIEKIVLGE